MSSYFRAGLALAMVLLFTGVALGQTGAGSLIGRVTDVSGAVLPGITITATSSSLIGERQVFSDENGNPPPRDPQYESDAAADLVGHGLYRHREHH